MGVTVIVPWQDTGCEHRRAAWRWVESRYLDRHPDWQIRVSVHAGEWCKPAAIIEAARTASDLLVVADADVFCDGTAAAVDAVHAGAPWAVPHRLVHRLTPAATRAVLAGAAPAGQPCHQRPYRGTAGGGIVVLERATLLDVPPDVRFTGWGGEDGAWRDALRCLAGMEWRAGSEPLVHLWHPPQMRLNRHVGSPENVALAARYVTARGNAAAMRALMAEAA